jgi:uncharacterized protein YndB with AHSA1/START domain
MTATDVRDGVLERLPDGRRRLRFERVLSHPVERVWAALTQPGDLGGWWGDAELDLRQGGEFVMRWRNTDPEGNHPVMHATITALDPPRLLELSGDLHGVLRWELSPSGADATLLRFSSTLEISDDHVASALAGWHWHLDALAEALQGRPAELGTVDPAWHALHERYQAQLGGPTLDR